MRIYIFILFFTVMRLACAADQAVELPGTAIIGNQELPGVLSIVPWKKSRLPEMDNPPLSTFIDEALTPVERDSFRREIYYYNLIQQTERNGD